MNEQRKFQIVLVTILLIGFSLVILLGAHYFNKLDEMYRDFTDISISCRTGNPDNNTPGEIRYEVWNRYNYAKTCFFSDLNGTLNKVYAENSKQNWIEPNDPDWILWLARFDSIKKEATTGKKGKVLNSSNHTLSPQ